MTKRYDDPIEVELADVPGELRPLAFSWRGRRYAVQALLKYWREAGEEWDPQRARDHECFRVEADGGVYDLRYDRRAPAPRNPGPAPRNPGPAPRNPGPAPRNPGSQRSQWRLARVWD